MEPVILGILIGGMSLIAARTRGFENTKKQAKDWFFGVVLLPYMFVGIAVLVLQVAGLGILQMLGLAHLFYPAFSLTFFALAYLTGTGRTY